MYLKLITPAATYPVTVAEVKAHLNIDTSDSDTRLSALIAAATGYCEKEVGRAFVSQTWASVYDGFPSIFSLPLPPLISVSHIKYYSTANVLTTLDSATYRVTTGYENFGLIEAVDSWPDHYTRLDAVTVQFVAGYSSPPEEVKHAIKLLVGAWNEIREGEVMGSTKQVELGVGRLLGHLATGLYQ